MPDSAVRVGVIGTSWWSDAMYLPALKKHPQAQVVAVAGRDPERTAAFAQRWDIPAHYTDYEAMYASGALDAVVISSPNVEHYPMSMKAIERGIHVLCEKPLAMNYGEAKAMSEAASAAGVKTMVPFTYRFMPASRYLKRLIDEGYVGKPYHINARHFSGYARDGKYIWRFDKDIAGSGVAGDLSPHWIYLMRWFLGEIAAVTAVLSSNVLPREPRPNGESYPLGDDASVMIFEFENGAQGVLHTSAVAYEDTPFGSYNQVELHGSGGTLHSMTDWIQIHNVTGSRAGEGPIHDLPIPDDIWGIAHRDNVINSYKAVFREENYMTRGFISAIAGGGESVPDFYDGMKVQQVLDAALLSAAEQRRVLVSEIS